MKTTDRPAELAQELRRHAVFLHIATLGRYQDILDETAACLASAPLRRTAHRIVLGVVGSKPVRFGLPDTPVEVCRWSDDVAAFEHPTLAALQQYSKENTDAAVLYLNCLGGRHVGVGWDTRTRWRAMLMYLLVERYAESLMALREKDLYGVTFLPEPLPHMTSNNWWADAAYIAGLMAPAAFRSGIHNTDLSRFGPSWCDLASKQRHSAEFWVGSGPRLRAVSAFDIRQLGLPCNWLGSVPWWGVPGVDWLGLARRHVGGSMPLASRLRHVAIVSREQGKQVLRKALGKHTTRPAS